MLVGHQSLSGDAAVAASELSSLTRGRLLLPPLCSPRSRMWPRSLPSALHAPDLQYLKPVQPLHADAVAPVQPVDAFPAQVSPAPSG
jgi:hypothetical protein